MICLRQKETTINFWVSYKKDTVTGKRKSSVGRTNGTSAALQRSSGGRNREISGKVRGQSFRLKRWISETNLRTARFAMLLWDWDTSPKSPCCRLSNMLGAIPSWPL